MVTTTMKSPLGQLLILLIIGYSSIRPTEGFLPSISSPSALRALAKTENENPSFQQRTTGLKESSSSDKEFSLPRRSRRTQHKDAVIIGGGLAGLSAALYLSQMDPDRHITVIDKEIQKSESKKKTTIASFAAAGMLAPQSERLPKGHLLDICLASRRMYAEFVDLVETMARDAGEEGAPFLFENTGASNMEPWSVGYMASGGFLAPAFAGDSVATWAPPEEGGGATWMDETQVRELEPNLHPDVVGGWWFPEDASVDARRLTCSLYAACAAAGVQFLTGDNYEVTSLDLTDGECHGMWLKNGNYLKANSVLVANGAWMRNLLPVPITPHKGQSLSLKMPSDRPPILRRVLFAQDCYIVPKADGHIVIGATVEAGSFDGNVTPAGLLQILTHALQLIPGLQDLPVSETWAGLRPTTPDKGPILGKSPWKNLFLAGGYWRNGVLLAPKTAQLLASVMSGLELSPKDEELLQAFSWDRFTAKGGGAALAASARYAASMHPIQSRKSGLGVAAAVGTELGSYSTAKVAKAERERDRQSLWTDLSDDDSFERAASLGRQDAQTFTFGDSKQTITSIPADDEKSASPSIGTPVTTDSSAGDSGKDGDQRDILSIYQTIKANKEKQELKLPDQEQVDNRPDPGFRVFHVDSGTGESREVPPYTTPADFLLSIGKQKEPTSASKSSKKSPSAMSSKENTESISDDYNEKTYDGYQAIQDANSSLNREDELKAMRKARMSNRLGQSGVDESLLGPLSVVEEEVPTKGERNTTSSSGSSSSSDVGSMYERIQKNKSKRKMALPDSSGATEEKPDPGFRIYHVDSETGESREVPPYTSPSDFLQSIAKEKKQTHKDAQKDAPTVSESKPSEISSGGINGVRHTDSDDYSEKTYDGYQDIQSANSRATRQEELEAMRNARQQNRVGQKGIDESKLNETTSLL